ncbi:MAG TPA: hypothetical protein VHC95_00200 [Opitutales bacterium]|nr:hypothetical protein [Opitutales bacterium]
MASALAQTPPAPAAATATEPVPAVSPTSTDNGSLAVPYARSSLSINDTADASELAIVARSALANGFASRAVDFFRAALAKPGLDAATTDSLNLGLATALLAQGKAADASAALNQVLDRTTPAYALRATMLTARSQDWAAAAVQANLIDPATLPVSDRPWYYALEAKLAEQRNDIDAASKAWQQAQDTSLTVMQKAQFEAALWRAKMLLTGAATQADAETLLGKADSSPNPSVGAEFVRTAAVMLNKLPGQHDRALNVLKTWIGKPGIAHLKLDALRLEFALIDNEDIKHPNAALDEQYLEGILQDRLEPGAAGQDELVQMQKTALAFLENMLYGGATPATGDVPSLTPWLNPADLLQFVNGLVSDQPSHPLLKQLRLLQAQLALSLNRDEEATAAANAVLALPADAGRDTAREDALRQLAVIAWRAKPPQYRRAADYLGNLLKLLPADYPDRQDYTRLMADLYFKNGDYDSAATYYTNLLNDPHPPALPGPGVLLMRAVESELRSGKLNDALALLQQTGYRGDLDDSYTTNQWQAWFNVLMALSDAGREQEAFTQITRLLDPEHGASLRSDSLRLRLAWLDARLATDLQQPDAAAKAAKLRAAVEQVPEAGVPGLDRNTRRQLLADAIFLQYKAAANGNRPDDQEGFYNELQKNFSDTEDAITAVMSKASELASDKLNKTAEAQRLMADLANRLTTIAPNSPWIPAARYQEALFAAARGSSDQYVEALGLLSNFIKNYPAHPMVYEAKLQEADLLRKLNHIDGALQIYNDLLKNSSRTRLDDPMVAKAARGKADCLLVLAGDDPAKRKDTMEELERLFNQEALPLDARVESGYDWGYLLENDPNGDHAANLEAAANVYMAVVSKFLFDLPMRDELFKTHSGSTWMADCLFHLGDIYRQQMKFDDAWKTYQLVVDNIPAFKSLAQSYQQSLGPNQAPAIEMEPPPPPPSPPATPPSLPPAPAIAPPEATAPPPAAPAEPAATTSPAATAAAAATTPPADTGAPPPAPVAPAATALPQN